MRRLVPTLVLALLALGTVTGYAASLWRSSHALTPEDHADIQARLATFPQRVGSPPFVGTSETMDDEIVRGSGADYYASIQYEAPDGGNVRLYLGASARSGAWFHVPSVCMPAAGWTARKLDRVSVEDVPGRERGLPVWRLELAKGGDQMLVYYWFHMGKRIVMSPFERARLRFQDLLQGRMEQPVQIVILYAPVLESLEATEERVQTLTRLLWPRLSTVLVSGDS